jgi:hypothetical protein
VYYGLGNSGAVETSFPFQVLKLALSKTGQSYVLQPSPIGRANHQRVAAAMVADAQLRADLYGLVAAFDDGSFKTLFLTNPDAVDKRFWYEP